MQAPYRETIFGHSDTGSIAKEKLTINDDFGIESCAHEQRIRAGPESELAVLA